MVVVCGEYDGEKRGSLNYSCLTVRYTPVSLRTLPIGFFVDSVSTAFYKGQKVAVLKTKRLSLSTRHQCGEEKPPN